MSEKKYDVEGDFSNLNEFDFVGVYHIYDGNEIIYIGSAYTRNIKERLKQYKGLKNTGNTLLHAICKKDYDVPRVCDIEDKHRKDALDKIMKFTIKAYKHIDAEYTDIKNNNPKYNTAGCEMLDTDCKK